MRTRVLWFYGCASTLSAETLQDGTPWQGVHVTCCTEDHFPHREYARYHDPATGTCSVMIDTDLQVHSDVDFHLLEHWRVNLHPSLLEGRISMWGDKHFSELDPVSKNRHEQTDFTILVRSRTQVRVLHHPSRHVTAIAGTTDL